MPAPPLLARGASQLPLRLALALLAVLSLSVVPCRGFLDGRKPDPVPIRPLSPPQTTHKDVPYPYVGTSVTAALFTMSPSESTKYDGEGKDNIRVDIAGQGPVYWSVSRWNQGDLSPRLAPRHPFAQVNLNDFPGDKGYSTDDPREFSAQAWRPDIEKGVMLATVARNGARWNDGAPLFYATVACVTESSGFGYSMKTGQFGNNNPNLDVTLGKAGEQGEAVIDVAVAWFPYEQGWTGGYVDAPPLYSKNMNPRWVTPSSHSPDLPNEPTTEMLQWSERGARLRLPGVRPYEDGMLFLTSTDPGKMNNDLNVMGAYTKPWGKGWRIQAREDKEEDPSRLVDSAEHMFAFLYVPFASAGLVGGNVAKDGQVVKGAGDFHVSRTDEGAYSITIQGGSKGPSDGVLLLQVTGRDEDNRKFAKHAFMSYNYTGSGAILVEAHRLAYLKNREGVMEETFPFVDTAFSFMWVDFQHPVVPLKEMFTGRLPVSVVVWPYWVGFFLGLGLGAAGFASFFILALAHGTIPLALPLSGRSWSNPFGRPQPLIPVELEEEELLRGPYSVAAADESSSASASASASAASGGKKQEEQ